MLEINQNLVGQNFGHENNKAKFKQFSINKRSIPNKRDAFSLHLKDFNISDTT